MVLRASTIAKDGRWKHSLREMKTIMSAISLRDEKAAHQACVEHVEAAGKVALEQHAAQLLELEATADDRSS